MARSELLNEAAIIATNSLITESRRLVRDLEKLDELDSEAFDIACAYLEGRIDEGLGDTLGTLAKNAVSRFGNNALAGVSQKAAGRLDVRQTTDALWKAYSRYLGQNQGAKQNFTSLLAFIGTLPDGHEYVERIEKAYGKANGAETQTDGNANNAGTQTQTDGNTNAADGNPNPNPNPSTTPEAPAADITPNQFNAEVEKIKQMAGQPNANAQQIAKLVHNLIASAQQAGGNNANRIIRQLRGTQVIGNPELANFLANVSAMSTESISSNASNIITEAPFGKRDNPFSSSDPDEQGARPFGKRVTPYEPKAPAPRVEPRTGQRSNFGTANPAGPTPRAEPRLNQNTQPQPAQSFGQRDPNTAAPRVEPRLGGGTAQPKQPEQPEQPAEPAAAQANTAGAAVNGAVRKVANGVGAVTAKLRDLAKLLQNKKPIQNWDQQYEQLRTQIVQKFPKLANTIKAYGPWAVAHPAQQVFIIGLLTAIASLAAGPAGAAVAATLMTGGAQLLKSGKITPAQSQAAQTADAANTANTKPAESGAMNMDQVLNRSVVDKIFQYVASWMLKSGHVSFSNNTPRMFQRRKSDDYSDSHSYSGSRSSSSPGKKNYGASGPRVDVDKLRKYLGKHTDTIDSKTRSEIVATAKTHPYLKDLMTELGDKGIKMNTYASHAMTAAAGIHPYE